MKTWCVVLLLFFWCPLAFAEEAASIALEKAPVDLHDRASIKRGGKFFANTCMVCHTMVYMRYNRLAKNVGVIYEKMPVNVTKWPLDVKPPDLSLEVSRRGADWVYTYLHSFYVDPTRPTGSNNLLLHNTAMTNILAAYQGQEIKLPETQLGKSLYHKPQWFDLVQQKSPGSMTPAQFDATIADVVNFLAYASTPYKNEQENLGKWVIGYLLVLFILAYCLKKAYWKDIQRSSHDKR